MFNNNERVNHFKFGKGTITEVDIKDDMLKSIVTVNFDSGETKKLSLSSFGPNSDNKVFVTCENDEIRKLVDSLLVEEEEKRKKIIENRNKKPKIDFSKVYKYDENENVLTRKDWERCYDVADTYRFYHESRAVVMDNENIFINAASGLRYCDANPRFGDKVYERCEGIYRSKYAGAKWRYATKEELKEILDNWEDIDNDTK